MNDKWNYKVSTDYKIKAFLLVVVCWVAFNIISGFITGDTTFPDNFFILIILSLIAAFKCSYSVSYKNGQMNEYQIGMLTSNIDLYKIKDVKDVNGSLKLYGADDSQFTINYDRFSDYAHDEVLACIKPLYGKEPEIVAKKSIKHAAKKVIENYPQSIFCGIFLTALSIIGYFTGIIYFPSRHGFIERADGEEQFIFFLITFGIMGIGSIIYGFLGLRGQRKA